MSFPHPQTRQENRRKGDISNDRGVVWVFLKWTVNIADDRNAKDDVNPAEDGAFGFLAHDAVSYLNLLAMSCNRLCAMFRP